jgi:predicted GNAT family acetyltransferase
MDYKIEEERIVASDEKQPFVGEISFPKVTGVPNRVIVERVFVHPDYRSQGIGAELVSQFVKYATSHKLTVKLMCPYAVKQFGIHPEYQQLLLPEDRF